MSEHLSMARFNAGMSTMLMGVILIIGWCVMYLYIPFDFSYNYHPVEITVKQSQIIPDTKGVFYYLQVKADYQSQNLWGDYGDYHQCSNWIDANQNFYESVLINLQKTVWANQTTHLGYVFMWGDHCYRAMPPFKDINFIAFFIFGTVFPIILILACVYFWVYNHYYWKHKNKQIMINLKNKQVNHNPQNEQVNQNPQSEQINDDYTRLNNV